MELFVKNRLNQMHHKTYNCWDIKLWFLMRGVRTYELINNFNKFSGEASNPLVHNSIRHYIVCHQNREVVEGDRIILKYFVTSRNMLCFHSLYLVSVQIFIGYDQDILQPLNHALFL